MKQEKLNVQTCYEQKLNMLTMYSRSSYKVYLQSTSEYCGPVQAVILLWFLVLTSFMSPRSMSLGARIYASGNLGVGQSSIQLLFEKASFLSI